MKLLAIDGNSLVNRAFYGVRTLTSADGVPTNAVYGFLNMLQKLRDDYSPQAVCVCFDRPEKTFRHEKFSGYKAQRKPMPDDLAVQMPLVKQALALMGITCLEIAGFEADDLLGTLARECTKSGNECIIATGDRDSLQFIAFGATVSLVTSRMGQTVTEDYDTMRFMEKYSGLTPDKIVDLKAIMGDSSDNIPGVKGIGEKGAMDLLTRFGSLDGVYENINDPLITANMRKKLEDGREMAYMSYELALGCTQAPVGVEIAALVPRAADEPELFALLDRLQLKTIIKKLSLSPGAKTSPQGTQFETLAHVPVADARVLEALKAHIESVKTAALCVSKSFDLCAVFSGGKCFVLDEMTLGERANMDFLAWCLTESHAEITLHDAKPVFRTLLERGLTPNLPSMDTALAAYLLNPSSSGYSIAELAREHLSGFAAAPEIYNDEDARNLLGTAGESLAAIAQHVQIIAALGAVFESELSNTQMLTLLREIELPLMRVLADMERLGMAMDKAGLLAFGDGLVADIERLENEIYEHANERFNIGSPRQLGVILFEKLGLKAYKKTKTGYSTDAEALEKLSGAHAIVDAILDWRKLTKLKSTYVEGLSKVTGADGRIHSTFHQTVTTTGRLSSSDPNLQNIPIRRALGSEIRRFFVAPPGQTLIDADYSQIELRILAHMARDEIMLNAFENGEDIHAVTASQVFNVPLESVNSQMRSRAKAVNFGIVYGISAFSLSDDISTTVKEAQSYMDAYFEKYTGVRDYMADIKEKARADGFVTTLYGRRRYLPELKSSNFNIRAFGERVALNTPIQGTAADIIKIAMINVWNRLRKEGIDARLILQVHDELILECAMHEQERTSVLLREEMERAASLSVRLAADVSHGENWYDAKG